MVQARGQGPLELSDRFGLCDPAGVDGRSTIFFQFEIGMTDRIRIRVTVINGGGGQPHVGQFIPIARMGDGRVIRRRVGFNNEIDIIGRTKQIEIILPLHQQIDGVVAGEITDIESGRVTGISQLGIPVSTKTGGRALGHAGIVIPAVEDKKISTGNPEVWIRGVLNGNGDFSRRADIALAAGRNIDDRLARRVVRGIHIEMPGYPAAVLIRRLAI